MITSAPTTETTSRVMADSAALTEILVQKGRELRGAEQHREAIMLELLRPHIVGAVLSSDWLAELIDRTAREAGASAYQRVISDVRREVLGTDVLFADDVRQNLSALALHNPYIGEPELAAEEGTPAAAPSDEVYLEKYSVGQAYFGGLGGDVSKLVITREAWNDLAQQERLTVTVTPAPDDTE